MSDYDIKISVFCCSTNINAGQLSRHCNQRAQSHFKVIGLPCSGKVNIPYLVKAFETGSDGVVIVTCKTDECRYLEGNMRAEKRAQAVEGLLEEIGIDSGRMAVFQLTDQGLEEVAQKICEFRTKITKVSQATA